MRAKVPCIRCDRELFDRIEPFLIRWGYEVSHISLYDWDSYPLLIINNGDEIGKYTNVAMRCISYYNRELVDNVDEFLRRAAALKGFKYNKGDFILEELKPGMIVKFRYGAKMLVIETKDHKIALAGINTDSSISEYNSSLCSKSDSKMDIMQVFEIASKGYSLSSLLNSNNDSMLKLIWERPELICERPRVVEVTLQEIADKFGVSIEQLRIKQ